jgi:cold-inducible RNA-binding protein
MGLARRANPFHRFLPYGHLPGGHPDYRSRAAGRRSFAGSRRSARALTPAVDDSEIESNFHEESLAVRLFIGNLPYSATEADLRAHFASIAEPSHVVMPVDRETGRPRGFAFVEFVDRANAEAVIRKFDAQPFQGRNLAVSEARPREERPPGPPRPGGFAPREGGFGGPRPGGGFGGPRPAPGGGFGPRPGPGGPPGSRDRSANFGPPAPPKRLRGKKGSQQEHKPRGPIKERSGGRIYAVDDLEDDSPVDLDDVSASPAEDDVDDVAASPPEDDVDDTPEEKE